MIKYHNAFDANVGKVVSIDDVTPENRTSMRFFCIGCGTEMEAVLGQKREHHFRHKEVGDCNPETYLHRLAKRVLKHKFDTQTQFPVKYYVQNECSMAELCEFKRGYGWQDCSSIVPKTVDFKEFYDTCTEEVWYRGFRADLMLSHSEFPDRKPVFLEVSVTHDCTPEKIDSKIRIIEMKVRCEKDTFRDVVENDGEYVPSPQGNWNHRYGQQVDESPIKFYNFKRIDRQVHRFSRLSVIKDDNEIYHIEIKPDAVTCHNVDSEHNADACFEVTIAEENIPQRNTFGLYGLGIALSYKRGLGVKHCILCQNYRRCIRELHAKKPPSNEYIPTRIPIKHLSIQNHETVLLAYSCDKYKVYDYSVQRIIQSFNQIPYKEWVKEVELQKG